MLVKELKLYIKVLKNHRSYYHRNMKMYDGIDKEKYREWAVLKDVINDVIENLENIIKRGVK